MLFSIFGEISLTIIGLLYVFDCWFDSFISFEEFNKNKEEEEEDKKIAEEARKRMYT